MTIPRVIGRLGDPTTNGRATSRIGAVDGATFVLDASARIAAVWGKDPYVLWAEGEPAMLVGPDGTGKTTIANQFVFRRIGIGPPDLLGYPVAPDERKVLYLALDRPRQAARSMRRMVDEADRTLLRDRLVVWPGQLPFDVSRRPDELAAFAAGHGAGTLVIDCLKDLCGNLSDEDTGAAIKRAMQACAEEACIDVLALHHQRKAQSDNKAPRKLSDIYGSRWLFAGCGSVLSLWGEAGDPIVEFAHLKQPADVVGPLTLLHDNRAGRTTVVHASDVVRIVASLDAPAQVKDVAVALFKRKNPSDNDIEKARRKLNAAVEDGALEKLPAGAGAPVAYRVTEKGHGGSRGGVTGEGHGPAPLKGRGRDPRHTEHVTGGHDDTGEATP